MAVSYKKLWILLIDKVKYGSGDTVLANSENFR